MFLALGHSAKARSRHTKRLASDVIQSDDGRVGQQLSQASGEYTPTGHRRNQKAARQALLPQVGRNACILGYPSRRGVQEAHGLSNARRGICLEQAHHGMPPGKPNPTDGVPQRHGRAYACEISTLHRYVR